MPQELDFGVLGGGGGGGGVKNLGICDGAPSTARSSLMFLSQTVLRERWSFQVLHARSFFMLFFSVC